MSRYRISNTSQNEGVVSIDGKWTTVAAGGVVYSDRKPGNATKNLKVTVVAENPKRKASVSMSRTVATGVLKVAGKADSEKFSDGSSSGKATTLAAVKAIREANASSTGEASSGSDE